WIRMGAVVVVAARPQARQPVGVGSLPHIGGRHADSRARYVRALLSDGLRRQGWRLRLCLYVGNQLARPPTVLRQSPVMIYRALPVLMMVVVLALVFGLAANAQEQFRLLGGKEIQTRVIGNDITDSSHWSMYLRSDGALIRDEMGRKRT